MQDVCNDGEFSCAVFVSGLLLLNGYITKPHATVESLRRVLLENSNAHSISEADVTSGDVVFWEKIVFPDGSENEHVGFALSKEEAVSTSFSKREVARHSLGMPLDAGDKERKITLAIRLG
jgi:hypothetical protein